ncbi:uncharacterized protein LOC108158988 [Drosophila miranda]|uniref:uncharacterized protein LOC108158988 n=1 Tax=Drosophila miranda TaxID=7229 RepID=UPI0007E75BF0|nr:uncharacterized protein LOC108158988 [Drosophila miranda]
MRLKLFLVFAILLIPPAHSAIHSAVDIIEMIRDVTNAILKVCDVSLDDKVTGTHDKQRQLMNRIEAVDDHIRNLEQMESLRTALTIETLIQELHQQSQLQHKLNLVKDLTTIVKTRYAQLRDYVQHKHALEAATLLKFAEWNVDPGPSSLAIQLELLHSVLFEDEGQADNKTDFVNTLLSQLTLNYEESPGQMCMAKHSAQQFPFQLYTSVALTELKAYSMMEFSWMIQRELGKGNFTQEVALMRNNYARRMESSVKVLSQVMARSGRVYWRCDPGKDKHVSGETYDRVTRLLQGYVENEANLGENQGCWGTCGDYPDTRSNGCYKGDKELCGKQTPCNGRLYNCGDMDSDVEICPSEGNSSRRYEYIQSDDGATLGRKSSNGRCESATKTASSLWYYILWRCSYCFCLCDEQGPLSDRYFNLRDSLSDFMENKVVTGVRFVKSNRVFHLQLQQGELLPRGAINVSSLEWLPLDSYHLNDVDVRNDYDYHTLTVDSRAMDLDEITSGSNRSLVVTGARFRVWHKHLNLEVRFSYFDFPTGRLVEPKRNSVWLNNSNTEKTIEKPRQVLIVKEAYVPTAADQPSLPLSTSNQCMNFFSSSKVKDASQNTLPFIDVQEVVPHPAVPLAGLGIFYKSRPGSGGFFAPKVVTYDYSQYLKEVSLSTVQDDSY